MLDINNQFISNKSILSLIGKKDKQEGERTKKASSALSINNQVWLNHYPTTSVDMISFSQMKANS